LFPPHYIDQHADVKLPSFQPSAIFAQVFCPEITILVSYVDLVYSSSTCKCECLHV
jgi:hypothetical protein